MNAHSRHATAARILTIAGALALACHAGAAPTESSPARHQTPRAVDGHPDLSGDWIGLTGSVFRETFPSTRDAAGSIDVVAPPPAGAVARANAPNADELPAYKDPANLVKARQLYADGTRSDPVVACGQPGLPRIGAPNKIVQTHKELIFLYSDLSGMVWRVIPVDGRSFRSRVDPSFYGDSVGHWEGDTLVVEARSFIDETWFGEYGYLHSDQMRVIERFKREGDNLIYQATVDDPVMLSKPWVKPPVEMHATKVEIEEPLKCVPTTYEAGHHVQRRP
jgi:hypothetical protein